MPKSDHRETLIASLLAERYEVLQFIGQGGFASVYQVVNRRLGRLEALKVLNADHTEEPDFAKRFEQEARVAASLDHPNIVKIFDYGQAGDLFWFSMQLINGPPLIRELKQKGTMDERTTARLGVGVLEALAYSHNRGVIHRDVKPENILLDGEGRPYLMDFGIAKSEESLVKTRTGMILGSPAYIAPEQLHGVRVDGRADLYALGVTLYRMLTDSFPFLDDDPFRMAMKRFTMPPEPLTSKRPGIAPDLETVVMRALEREPDHRFQSAAEMRDALACFLAGEPPPPPRLRRAAPPFPVAGPTSSPVSDIWPPAPESLNAPWPDSRSRPSAVSSSLSDSLPTIATAAAERKAPIWKRWTLLTAVLVVAVAGGLTLFLNRSDQSSRASRLAPSEAAAKRVAGGNPITQPTAPPAVNEPTPVPETVVRAVTPEIEIAPTRVPRNVAPVPRQAMAKTAELGLFPTRGRRVAKSPPQTETEVPIELSADLRRAHAGQLVGLSVSVGQDGRAKQARVISAIPDCEECNRAALAAVLKYRFQPARDQDGVPMEMRHAVSLIIPE